MHVIQKFTVLLALIAMLASCGNETPKNNTGALPDSVGIRFENKMKALGFKIDSVGKTGSYYVNTGKETFEVNLENARQDYAMTRNYDLLDKIVDDLTERPQTDSIANWEWAKKKLYVYLVQRNNDFKGVPHKEISGFLNSVYIVYDGKRFIWVDSAMIETWRTTEKEVSATADENMYQVLRRATIQKDSIDGVGIAYLKTEIPMAASFMFIPKFKFQVDQAMGWPCYGVAPSRNFACMFSRVNFIAFRDKFGPRVKKEYLTGVYPLSLEMFRFNDKGFEVVGEFQ